MAATLDDVVAKLDALIKHLDTNVELRKAHPEVIENARRT